MPATFAQLLGALHRERFVGRTSELAACERWLAESDSPPILAVHGAGGIGKTWLLEEFGRRAHECGWDVQRRDAATALAAGVLEEAATHDARAGLSKQLLIFDAIDALGPAVGELQRMLSALAVGTRVVLSSRHPLRDGVWRTWEPLMQHVSLGPLSWAEQRAYLDLRGVDDVARREQVLLRSGGHPLTLSLAVDLVVSSSGEELAQSSLWRSTVRMTAEELVGEVGSRFRDAVDAAAVLYRADRNALGAVLGAAEADQAFVRLGSWSASRVIADRLVLHDDVRRAVVEDLRLHRPERLDEIRRAALRHYRRAAAVGGEEGARWSIERLHLVGRDLFGVNHLYDEHPALTVMPATTEDMPELLDLRRRVAPVPGIPAVESDPDRLGLVLADPQCVTHLVRDADGGLVGFAFYLYVTERNRALLGDGKAMTNLVDAAAETIGCPGGRLPEQSNVRYFSTVVATPQNYLATASVLANNVVTVLASEGAYLFVPSLPHYVQLIDSFLAKPLLPGLTEDGQVLQPRLLDLSRCGMPTWIRAMMAGRPLPQIPLGPDLAAGITDVVAHFEDDEVLAGSMLAPIAEPEDRLPAPERAQAVRALMNRALRAEGRWPTPEARIRDGLAAAGITDLPDLAIGPTSTAISTTATAASGDTRVEVRVLGRFAVSRNGRSTAVPQGAVGTTVALLALRHRVPAEELIEQLWPEADPSVGRERLRTVLARLQRSLGRGVVVRRGAEITLGEGVVVDADAFAAAATTALHEPGDAPDALGRCQAAVELYGGELLPGDRYSEWTAGPRERFTRLLLALLDRLAGGAQARGDVEGAVRWIERAIDADPYDEDRYVRAAALLAAAGRRGRALALLARAQSAAAALGVPVGTQVRALRRTLRSTR